MNIVDVDDNDESGSDDVSVASSNLDEEEDVEEEFGSNDSIVDSSDLDNEEIFERDLPRVRNNDPDVRHLVGSRLGVVIIIFSKT